MTVNAPARPLSGTMDVEEFMAFLETRPEGERWDWQPERLTQPENAIELLEFGLRCRVADLYRGTPLDPERGMSA